MTKTSVTYVILTKATVTYTIFLGLWVLVLCGCGENVSLRGRITFSDDNKPLTTGMVFFENDSFQSRGRIEKDGTYRVGTLKQKDGLPPGTYRVYIMGAALDDPTAPPESGRPLWPLIETKLTSPATSEISIDVDRSTRTFDFSVAPNENTKKKLENLSK